jgi:hypothetical protein
VETIVATPEIEVTTDRDSKNNVAQHRSMMKYGQE